MKDKSSWSYEGTPWYKSRVVLAVVAMGLVESTFLFIQFAKTMENESAEGLSLLAFMILMFTSISWVVWGALAHDAAVLITATVNVIGSMLMVGAIYRYSGDSNYVKAFDEESMFAEDTASGPADKAG